MLRDTNNISFYYPNNFSSMVLLSISGVLIWSEYT